MALTFSFCLSGFVCDCQWLHFFFSPPFFPMDEWLEATRPLSLSPNQLSKPNFVSGFPKIRTNPWLSFFFVVVGFSLLRTELDTRALQNHK